MIISKGDKQHETNQRHLYNTVMRLDPTYQREKAEPNLHRQDTPSQHSDKKVHPELKQRNGG